ncbi:hypothetical protein N24_2740 [Corynebacterium suranareeae]|uniref:Uncharacterized protein n=1 Tax=Corynebacterium suranareeae TaxID=2506452 RepID=A0A169S388_9CORY|nr:hypothetical protein [Corynebacterium suranareeae]BAU97002.1 hypothetical protein N24_2740 [Corynebacterium suranareeae]
MPNSKSPRLWNVAAAIFLGFSANQRVMRFKDDNLAPSILWGATALVVGVLVWALWNYKKPPGWLIPRTFALSAVPILMLYLVAQSWTSFWVGLMLTVILTLIFSGFLQPYEDSNKRTNKARH